MEELVAYCRIVPKGIAYENISIGRVLVLNNYRRKGIAQKMIKEALEFIKNNLRKISSIICTSLCKRII